MSFTKFGIWIGGIAVELAIPFQIRQIRGIDPWRFQFITSKPDEWISKIGLGVDITITTPNASNTYPQTRVFKNWYVTDVHAYEGGTHAVSVQDARWYANRLAYTGNFNVRMQDGRYRPDSLASGVPWKALSAIKEVLKGFGFTVKVDKDVDQKLKQIVLPNNQGNSVAGGWVCASMAEILPPMLESIRADIFMNDNGECEITDRQTDYTDNIIDIGPFEGRLAIPERKWQKPKQIVVQFEQRVERILEYNDDPTATSSGVQRYDQFIENAVPVFDLANSRLNADGSEVIWFDEFNEYCKDYLGFNKEEFRKRYLRELIIPYGQFPGGQEQQEFDIRLRAELARQAYRTTWFVKHTNFDKQESRPYANQILGRLGPDGNTQFSQYVFCDHTYFTQFSWIGPYDPAGNTNNPFHLENHKFSKGKSFPTVFNDVNQAPYNATWVNDGANGLIFQLIPRRLPTDKQKIVPGLLNKDISYGSAQDIVQNLNSLQFESTAEVTNKFKLRVYYHGLLAMDVDNKNKRLYEITNPGFSTGLLDKVIVRATGITANWQYDDATGSFPGILLNKDQLNERAKFIADQIFKTYSDARAGVLTFAGIDPIIQDYQTRGNIYQRVIEIQPEEVTVHYVIQPEIRDIEGEPEKLDGVAPNRIG